MSVPRFPRLLSRRIGLSLAALLTAVLLGGWIHGPQSTFDTEGPVAKTQLEVFYVTVWVTGVIFVIVAAVLAYATVKFKARSEADEHAEPPPQSHGNPLVELSLIFASVAALVVIAVPTLRAIFYTYDVPEEDKPNAYTITATGLQWWFRFEYPSEEIDVGGNKSKLTVANELVIPAGRPVRINLRTYDVIHSFWVPKLAGKVDMMPNRANHLWLKADKAGYYWGQCAEYCGESHAVMRFRVIALDEPEFNAWLVSQKQGAREAHGRQVALADYDMSKKKRNSPGYSAAFDADPFGNWHKLQAAPAEEDVALITHGRQLFQEKTCVTCHVVRGHFVGGNNAAPELTHIGARSTFAGGLLETNAANLHRWVTDPANVKPGNKMWKGLPLGGSTMPGYMNFDFETGHLTPRITVNDAEGRALTAYLLSLK